MDFLEDIELYNEAMENAYMLITKKKTLDDIYYDLESEELESFPLPFDPLVNDGRSADILDMLIEHFTNYEEYEKCAALLKIKNKCSKTLIESEPPRLNL
jgi:hypothetical protein|tara:strand:+ start:31 stop:330 length:300 start_codon:yes stop_codon:yes gene_type:complete